MSRQIATQNVLEDLHAQLLTKNWSGQNAIMQTENCNQNHLYFIEQVVGARLFTIRSIRTIILTDISSKRL